MSGAIGTGHFVSWDGGAMFISRATQVTPMHSHYAMQIAFGSERGIRFRGDDREPWTEYDGVVIASRQPHTMDSSHVPFGAVLFVEPETREGRALAERYAQGGINPLPAEVRSAVAPALFSTWREERSRPALIDAAKRVVQELTGGVEPSLVSDERILRAIAYINSHLEGSLTLEEVAAEAFLSPSRFRHLFVAETGMALRPYILWRRFLHVWDLIMAGSSLSAAAHAAGFADAAHLTRTSRRMFGFPPSALQFGAPLQGSSPAGSQGGSQGVRVVEKR